MRDKVHLVKETNPTQKPENTRKKLKNMKLTQKLLLYTTTSKIQQKLRGLNKTSHSELNIK